ncbi:MAG: NUDIX hydrolase [bacterium]
MLYRNRPKNFNPEFEAVGCFCEYDGKILLLLRQDHKPEPNTWGLPGGKLAAGEDIYQGMRRELKEETDLNGEEIKYISKAYSRFFKYDFIYHIFHLALAELPKIIIDESEHKDFIWVTPDEALKIDLIENLDKCIEIVYGKEN